MTRPRTFAGPDRRWRIRWGNPGKEDGVTRDAVCDFDRHTITVRPGLNDKRMLAALSDEVCHAHFPALDNTAVDRFSDAIADLLERMGFKR